MPVWSTVGQPAAQVLTPYAFSVAAREPRGIAGPLRRAVPRDVGANFPSICHARLPFCPEVVSNGCLKFSHAFEIGGHRAIIYPEIRGQVHRGGGRRTGERA